MAKHEKGEKKHGHTSESAKVADIVTASKTLAEGKSFEHGMPPSLNLHINEGKHGKKRGAD